LIARPLLVPYFATRRSSDLDRLRVQRVQEKERRPGEGRLRRAGRPLQEQVEQDAAREVQQEAGRAEAARLHAPQVLAGTALFLLDRKSPRLNSSHQIISYAV